MCARVDKTGSPLETSSRELESRESRARMYSILYVDVRIVVDYDVYTIRLVVYAILYVLRPPAIPFDIRYDLQE